MTSPGQKWGGCGHRMAGFDIYSYCARCHDKGKGLDPCVEKPHNSDCKFCNVITSDQCSELSTPSYKLRKEKREAKTRDNTVTPSKETSDTVNLSLMDLASVSVIGAVDGQGTLLYPGLSGPAEKKKKVEKEKGRFSTE